MLCPNCGKETTDDSTSCPHCGKPVESPNRLEWAKHLWEEWKYRHENWSRTLYRSLSAIVIVATVPWIKQEYFQPISNLGTRIVYGLLPLVIFIPTCLLLAVEQGNLKSVESTLRSFRAGPSLSDSQFRELYGHVRSYTLPKGDKRAAFTLTET